jgi:uncharacterized membrane protein
VCLYVFVCVCVCVCVLHINVSQWTITVAIVSHHFITAYRTARSHFRTPKMTISQVVSVILKLQFKAKNMKWRDEYCIREKIGEEEIVEVEMEVAANLVSHS